MAICDIGVNCKGGRSLINDVGLRLDLGVRAVWSPQTEALFDICIIDTDAPSYKHHTSVAVLESAAKEKERIYQKAVEDRCGQFTPFVVSVDGLLHREANHFMKRIASSLARKWESLTQKQLVCQNEAIFCNLEIC